MWKIGWLAQNGCVYVDNVKLSIYNYAEAVILNADDFKQIWLEFY